MKYLARHQMQRVHISAPVYVIGFDGVVCVVSRHKDLLRQQPGIGKFSKDEVCQFDHQTNIKL